MLTLGIDTATEVGAVGLVEGSSIVGELSFAARLAQAERLIPAIERLMGLHGREPGELELIAVVSGPGSFTGLRIGLATAKGLAQALQVPLVGVPTLASYAARVGFWPERTLVVLHDRRNLVWWGEFHQGRMEGEERLWEVERLLEEEDRLKGALCLGSGAARYREELSARGAIIAPAELNRPSGARVALLGLERYSQTGKDELFTLEPRYLQRPLAEVSLESSQAKAKADPERKPDER